MKPILVIEQEYTLRGLGLLGERLDASGLPYRRLRGWDEPIGDLDAGDFAAVIAMGGTGHSWEEELDPKLGAERVLLRDAVEEGVPVLGICLGGQILARALGGDASLAAEPERGWIEIVPTDEARDDPVFRVLDRAAGVYQWHHDVFEPPAGATVLARSESAPNQGFRMDGADAWGIQFHPEVTPDLFELWIARNVLEVEAAGVDVDVLRRDVYRGAEESLVFRTAFFDAFIDRVQIRWDGP